jgi:hypothetical protein
VIDGLEDSEDYRGFEAAIIADYDAETAVERELVLRLASLLWRLRRIIGIETGLFQIQAQILRDRRNEMTTVHGKLSNQAPEVLALAEADRLGCNDPASSPRELTYCFLRLGNLDRWRVRAAMRPRWNAAIFGEKPPHQRHHFRSRLDHPQLACTVFAKTMQACGVQGASAGRPIAMRPTLRG